MGEHVGQYGSGLEQLMQSEIHKDDHFVNVQAQPHAGGQRNHHPDQHQTEDRPVTTAEFAPRIQALAGRERQHSQKAAQDEAHTQHRQRNHPGAQACAARSQGKAAPRAPPRPARHRCPRPLP